MATLMSPATPSMDIRSSGTATPPPMPPVAGLGGPGDQDMKQRYCLKWNNYQSSVTTTFKGKLLIYLECKSQRQHLFGHCNFNFFIRNAYFSIASADFSIVLKIAKALFLAEISAPNCVCERLLHAYDSLSFPNSAVWLHIFISFFYLNYCV